MKRFLCTALPIAALALAGCSGSGNGTDSAVPADKAAASQSATTPAAATGATTAAAPTTVTSQTPYTQGGTPGNADQATVKIDKCESTSAGVEMEAQITNTTKEKRTYIVTGLVFDEKKKAAGSAALMADDVEPGKTVKVTGTSNQPVKGKITCEASQIESLVSSS